MTANATRKQIRDRLRKRVGAAASTYWTDAELDVEIDVSGQEYWDAVIAAYPEDHFTTSNDFTTTADTEKYPVATTVTGSADDLYILRRVQIQDASGDWYDMQRFAVPDYPDLANSDVTGNLVGTRYALIGTDLYILPDPGANKTVRVWYIPTFTKFASDTATVDGVDGWEEFVVVDLAIKYRESQRQNTALLERQKAAMLGRIAQMSNRRHVQHRRITVRNARQGISAYN